MRPGPQSPRFLFSVLALVLAALGGCVEGPDEKERGGAPAFWYVAVGGLYRVDYLGTQARVPFLQDQDQKDAGYRAGAPDPGFQRLVLLSDSNTFSNLSLALMVETPLFTAFLPAGAGPRVMRLGWAGSRAYLLTDTGLPGVAVVQMDLISGAETILTPRLDNQGPGQDNPVSFDLADGGNQAYVLYQSGLLVAVNLYLDDRPEGPLADFGPGAKDLHVLDNGAVFAGGDFGLRRWEPGLPVREIADPGPAALVRVRDPEARSVIVALDTNELCEINVANRHVRRYLQPPETVRSIIPLETAWIKNTRVFPGIVLSSPPYQAGADNGYRFYIQDPDGPNADVTVTIEPADPAQNVRFISTGTDTIIFFNRSPLDEMDASFYGGDLPGPVTLRFTAVSYDGQTSQWEQQLAVGP